MSDVPSWLTEENINTASAGAKVVANNPAAVKAASGRSPPPPPPPSAAPPSPSPRNSGFNDVESGNAAPASTGGSSASEFVIEEAVLKDMQNWHLGLRICYMGAAICMSAAAALSLTGQSDVGLAFFAIYVLFFSALICCFECALTVCCRQRMSPIHCCCSAALLLCFFPPPPARCNCMKSFFSLLPFPFSSMLLRPCLDSLR